MRTMNLTITIGKAKMMLFKSLILRMMKMLLRAPLTSTLSPSLKKLTPIYMTLFLKKSKVKEARKKNKNTFQTHILHVHLSGGIQKKNISVFQF